VVIGRFHWVVVFVAINAAKRCKVAGYRMAFDALVPFALVFSAVNREVLVIMVPGGRYPCRFRVAILTSCGELCRSMVGIVGVIVIALVAAKASIGSIVVIAVVASRAVILDGSVRPIQHIVIAVNGEGRRVPIRVGRMAHGTICWNGQSHMVRIGRLVVVVDVAALACVGRIVVIPIVTGITIVGNDYVGSCQRIKIIVVKSGRHPCRFGVAILAISRKLVGQVVRVGRLVVVVCVAAETRIRGVIVVAVVAGRTIVGDGGVRPIQHIVIAVDGEGSRVPFGLGGVARCAIRRNAQSHMVRIGRLVVVVDVAALAGIGRIVVIAVVAGGTIICNG
jgi:hypothetical protein